MLNADTSYAIVSKSPLIQSIVIDYLVKINREQSIFVGNSLFEKSIKFSDTDEPNSRCIIISKIERNSTKIKNIDADDNIPEIVFEMSGLDPTEHKDHIRLIKQKIKRFEPELRLYKVYAILGNMPITNDSIEQALEYKYKGVHTTGEQVEILIEFINNPTEINLQRVVKVFNEDGYQKLINCVSMLVNDSPEWITNKYKEILDSAKFIKALLKITLITLKAETRDEFILYTLKEIIYK